MRVIRSPGRVWSPSLLLAAALAGASASAALVASAEAGVVVSMGNQAAPGTFFENLQWARPPAALQAPQHPLRTSAATEVNPIGGVFMAFLAQITFTSAHVATLHDFLAADEPTAISLELTGTPTPRPRQVMIHGLLADLDLALHALQEGGDEEHFMASRETGPGAYLRVAQQSRSRSGPY